MCWKQTTFTEDDHEVIQVDLGSNAAALDFAGVYLKNKNKEGEYFKLGTKGYRSLYKTTNSDGKKEAWAFRKDFSNYEYISISPTDYAAYSNPFREGYGDSDLLVTKGLHLPQSEKTSKKKTFHTKEVFSFVDIIKLNQEKEEKNTETQDVKGIESNLSHEHFNFSNSIQAPQFKETQKKEFLYKEKINEVSINWEKVPGVSGYRLEIFREEKGVYSTSMHDTKENSFTFSPSGGNYFYRVKCFIDQDGEFVHGAYSENYRFTKLYPGNCPEENITIHFSKYQDKHVYAKIDGTWYGTGSKYGEPTSIVNFPCPIKIEEYDFENDPNYIVTNLGKRESRIINSIDIKETNKEQINKKYGNQLINQSTIISSKIRLPS